MRWPTFNGWIIVLLCLTILILTIGAILRERRASQTFTCAMCHGTFKKVRSDKKALAEMRARNWPVPPGESQEVDVVCDDCFQEIETEYNLQRK